ncbi:hypothetical protein OH809_23730 [Streptomyces sp. NBC_00873]|uniref:hypothetical protein n=1 Tax=unclassified Streptomyces TaxID=2593676 RepID=UPI0038658815|nr:hypothetical protein OH809_23730 [Streptomyces sp. NBC_00873]WTA44550.1 hypothetical protein OH821_19565 [Streptomyces sp. NBC_00842]
MRGLTGSGERGVGRSGSTGGDTATGGSGAARSGGRRLTRWAANSTTLVGLAVLALLTVSCSTGGTGTRDEGPAGSQRAAQVTPSATAPSAKPIPRVDPVQLVKRDPRVSERVRTDLKPCTGKEYPVDSSYGRLTGGSAPDVVVNVMTCGDAVGVGTYVYRRQSNGTYENIFTTEQPAVYGTIDRGDLVVTTQVYEKKDAVAYPSGEEVVTYRWADDRFAEHDRVYNDFNRAVGNGEGDFPGPTEPTKS